MAVFEVYGGNKLKGDIIPQGAKNEQTHRRVQRANRTKPEKSYENDLV